MSINSEDQYVFNSSLSQQVSEFITSKKDVMQISDSNNGSYSNGAIMFDGAVLSNCGRPCDWSNAVLTIPTVMKVSGDLGIDVANVFAASWKHNIHAIDSMSVQLSNATVVEVCEFSNVPCHFKLLTELSTQEYDLFKYSYGFHKDNGLSLSHTSAANSKNAPQNYEYNNKLNGSNTSVMNSATTRGYNSDYVGKC